MFETLDHAEIPIPPPLRVQGERVWAYVEFPLHVPWFHVVYRLPLDDDGYLKRSLFLGSVDQVLQLGSESLRIDEIQVVLPQHMTGAGRWTMEPLAEIWEGVEQPKTGQKARVYVLANGTRYLHSGLCDSESELRDRKLIFRSPISPLRR